MRLFEGGLGVNLGAAGALELGRLVFRGAFDDQLLADVFEDRLFEPVILLESIEIFVLLIDFLAEDLFVENIKTGVRNEGFLGNALYFRDSQQDFIEIPHAETVAEEFVYHEGELVFGVENASQKLDHLGDLLNLAELLGVLVTEHQVHQSTDDQLNLLLYIKRRVLS